MVEECGPNQVLVSQIPCSIHLFTIPTSGKLLVSQDYLLFKGDHIGGTAVVEKIPFSSIASLDHTTSALLGFSKGIIITMEKSEEKASKQYAFYSFEDRDSTFYLLTHIWKFRDLGPFAKYKHKTIPSLRSLQNDSSSKKEDQYKHIRDYSSRHQSSSTTSSSSSISSRTSNTSSSTGSGGGGQKSLYDLLVHSDESLQRSEMLINRCLEMGADTLAVLHAQEEQLFRINDQLNDIHVTLTVSDKLIRGLTLKGSIINWWNSSNNKTTKIEDSKKTNNSYDSNNNIAKRISDNYNSGKPVNTKGSIDTLAIVYVDKVPSYKWCSIVFEYKRCVVMDVSEGKESTNNNNNTNQQNIIAQIPYEKITDFIISDRHYHFSICCGDKSIELCSVRYQDIIQTINNLTGKDINLIINEQAQKMLQKTSTQQLSKNSSDKNSMNEGDRILLELDMHKMKMDNSLDRLAASLSVAAQMGREIGSTLDKHNRILDNIDNKVTSADSRMTRQTKKMGEIIGN